MLNIVKTEAERQRPLAEPVNTSAIVPAAATSKADEILIPAGEFQMGCDASNPAENCRSNEQPLHTVMLDAYYIDKYEVTNARYKLCVDASGCTRPGTAHHLAPGFLPPVIFDKPQYADHPAVDVTWYQAEAYCTWAGKRLPTEAEWEKAARGTDGRIYPWGDTAPDDTLLNFNEHIGDTTVVGSYPSGASPYGVMDMAGNADEWVNDWWQEDYYAISPTNNPPGPDGSPVLGRVMRGGSWWDNNITKYVRSAHRHKFNPRSSIPTFGFRCARSPQAAATAPVVAIAAIGEILIPASEFQMGCNSNLTDIFNSTAETWCEPEEKPLHTVMLDTYYIDKYEVTNARYKLCVDAGGCTRPGTAHHLAPGFLPPVIFDKPQYADHPVLDVTWFQAEAYCKWAGKRLPTEAEWEKAARGTDGRIYPWGNMTPDDTVTNFNGNIGGSAVVGSYPKDVSPYGVMDMAGNAQEWVSDWFQYNYYSMSPTNNPSGPATGLSTHTRVMRGGSWDTNNHYWQLRSARRFSMTDDFSIPIFGIRCARSP